jgi:hypothetical protein
MTGPFHEYPGAPERTSGTSMWARFEGIDGGAGVDASGLEPELSDMHTVSQLDYENLEKGNDDGSSN